MIKRIVKRALRTGSGSSSSRALGLGLKNRGNQPNARRKNKQGNNDVKIDKKKMCPPFSDDSFSNIEILKYGFDASISFSSGTILNITCTKGFGLNLAENSTVKCVRGKWRPAKPKCLLCKIDIPIEIFYFLNCFSTLRFTKNSKWRVFVRVSFRINNCKWFQYYLSMP